MLPHHVRLHVEELGSRILPSAGPAAVPLLASTSTTLAAALSGSGSGTYKAAAVESGAGTEYVLSGTADLAGLGQVQVHGVVASLGFIQSGHAGGTLTFTNSQGTSSITLDVRGPAQNGFSPLPQQFAYRVVSATGQFQGLAGHGTLTLVLQAGPTVNGKLTGTWSLTIP